MNKFFPFIVLLIILAAQVQAIAAEPPSVGANAAIVIEAETGQVLYAKNADQPLHPASCGKILTAITVLDLADLNEKTTISAAAEAVDESSIYLEEGQEWLLNDLLRGALIKSANDACFALGEAVAGNEPLFVYMLNLKASLLGAKSANLCNTNGLPAEDHAISPRDLTLAARYAMFNPVFAETVKNSKAVIGEGALKRQIKTTNKLLSMREDIIGIKTGTTDDAGPCLLSASRKEGCTLIAGVFHSPDRYGESLRILDWARKEYSKCNLAQAGQAVAYLPIKGRKEQLALIAANNFCFFYRGEIDELKIDYKLPDYIYPPIEKGAVLGEVTVKDQNNNLLFCGALSAEQGVKPRFFDRFAR